MTHDRELVQTGLPIEEHDVAVDDMSLNDIANPKTVRDSSSVAELEILLKSVAPRGDIVRTRMDVTPVPNRFLQHVNVVWSDTLRVCQDLGDALWHRDLVDSQIRVRGDDRTP